MKTKKQKSRASELPFRHINSRVITKKQQDHLTKICKYCKGTGLGVFNKTEPCPNCVLPYQVVGYKIEKLLISECCGAEMQPEYGRCPDCKDGVVGEEIEDQEFSRQCEEDRELCFEQTRGCGNE